MNYWLLAKRGGLLSCLSIWLCLFVLAADAYQGSLLIFSFFSLLFLVLLVTGLYGNKSYSFIFLAVFLWLGFWLKLVMHLISDYAYVEPVGLFEGSIEAWDQVLWVATVACLGVIAGRLLYVKFRKPMAKFEGVAIPAWYPAYRVKLWFFLVVIIVSVGLLNAILGIQQIGLAARTILPWPLNAVIAWLVSIGSAMGVATLVWWDISLKKPVLLGGFSILVEAFVSTATLLSRGTFIFHSVPQLFALYENREVVRGFTTFRVLVLGCCFFLLFLMSIASVTTMRAYFYPHEGGFTTEDQVRLTRLEVLKGGIVHVKILIAQGEPQEGHLLELLEEQERLEKSLNKSFDMSELKSLVNTSISTPEKGRHESAGSEEGRVETEGVQSNKVVGLNAEKSLMSEEQGEILDEMAYQLQEGAIKQIMALAVDRWVGLEGVMAVVSYPEKNANLIIEAIKEKREIGKVTRYQEICKSSYQWTDSNVWQFASLPGAVAFLYFSGSLWVVFFGMCLFALIVQFAELAVYRVTTNPILCSLLGMVLANFVSQFGITPRQDLPYFFMIAIAVIMIALVQRIKYVPKRGEG